MNGSDFVLADTNALIHFLLGNPNVFHLPADKTIYISFVTEIEIQSKKEQSKADRHLVKSLLQDCIIVDINEPTKQLTIKLRRQRSIKTSDAIIVATAQYLDLPLITGESSFSKIPNLSLLLFESKF